MRSKARIRVKYSHAITKWARHDAVLDWRYDPQFEQKNIN
jgi:hypothetical protein